MHYSPNIIAAGNEVPVGELLALIGLPPCDTVRWTARRKAEIIAAVEAQLVTAEDACNWYGLSAEELDEWRRATERDGVAGLRVTCSQQTRRMAARQTAHAHS
ncbi:DUF1153 domain-containing protein [Novosphingobium sp. PS1R-30]|uniref:DUF1153 domain-containing protein n=1 Tax=Novosphingobium anseongense TaxID=3133436 RepID=A0ABU8RYW4_9SPHN|nr:MAG: DUF1153 domain-containing protein [Novosphingobium sp.]